MADFGDEGGLGLGSQQVPEVPAVAEMGGFGDEFVAAVPAAAVPAAALDNGNGAAGAADDFFSSAAPPAAAAPEPAPLAAVAPAAAAAAAPPPAAGSSVPAEDPRVAWAEQNRAALQQREAAEAAKKVELLAAAKEHLDKVYKAREVQLSQRKKSNREAEAVAGVAEGAVPQGSTPWERVISVCSFNSEALSKDPFKEMSRYKAVLLAAKAANISVGGPGA